MQGLDNWYRNVTVNSLAVDKLEHEGGGGTLGMMGLGMGWNPGCKVGVCLYCADV